jgi:hypothetical protein
MTVGAALCPFVSSQVISSMDVLPTALKLAGVNHTLACTARAYSRTGRSDGSDACVLDGRDMSAILLDQDGGKSLHDYLFFYNGPKYGEVSREIYAARFVAAGKSYKAHFITGPGLVPGTFAAQTHHDPPMFFDVVSNPSLINPSSTPPPFPPSIHISAYHIVCVCV